MTPCRLIQQFYPLSHAQYLTTTTRALVPFHNPYLHWSQSMYHSQLSVRSFTFVADPPRLGPNSLYRIPHATPWHCIGTSIEPIHHVQLNVFTPAPMESLPSERTWLTFEGPITGVSSTGVIDIHPTCSNYYTDIPLSYRVPYLELCGHVIITEPASRNQITATTPAAPALNFVMTSESEAIREQLLSIDPGESAFESLCKSDLNLPPINERWFNPRLW
ncbi:hypothetical protein PGT21_017140 [Puccinia graminis f. sp. tritici]|uniref:Uncharacterized protein n=1 Tax=Puccinia graminis f. sp. tritici TaxID=56615 RepID=A0A5B0QWD0_PUCGR|nr:hypothetical protein PGT21_017140 [Puccinia graminis f. sp. tritici]